MALAADDDHEIQLKRVSEIIRNSGSTEQALSDFAEILLSNTAAALADVERLLVRDVVAHAKRGEPNFESWCAENGEDIARAQHRIQEILEGGELTLSRLTVAAAQLRELASD